MGVRDRLNEALQSGRVLARSGILHPEPPTRLARMVGAVRHWGLGLGVVFAAGAARYADRVAIVDDYGTATYAQLDARTDAIARAFRATGIGEGDVVGLMCRNHRYLLEATGALAKVGADVLFLNTGFSAPQLREVMQREHALALVHDEEFTPIATEAGVKLRIVAWTDRAPVDGAIQTLDAMAARHAAGERPARPERQSRTIILTSGTTGTPKGAAQNRAEDTSSLSMLDALPYRARETMVIAAPCFHAWGLVNTMIGLLLGNTLVLRRRFDAEQTLADIAAHRAQVLAAVPVMLLRIVDVPAEQRARHDTSSLRFVPLSGSALPGGLAERFMDAFGDVLYNFYGSTEVGAVSIASPADLRAQPRTAGRPPRGVDVRLLDEHDEEVPPGETGRIFVRSPLSFDGYTDGRTKRVVDGFMQTGDTGHFDAAGRLFVDGRDDDMIISGGENVFPAEVEDVIALHPEVVEAVAIGVDDEEFGQRLKAFVVVRPGATVDAATLRDHVRANLANYKVPRDIEFVAELPRNTTGKLLRRELD
jgi:acyl-CoA synthetase (AMP-forming)/AMP-acid ligase II